MIIELDEEKCAKISTSFKDLEILKNRIRDLAFECGITRVDGNEYLGNGDENDFENFAIFMIKLMEEKDFLDNCKTWLWDEWEDDGEHYIDDVLLEVRARISSSSK